MAHPFPQVVILGGGFAGLTAARRLRRATVEVTLIDRNNYHLFQPLLYQVATASLSPGDIAFPIRTVVRHDPRTQVLMAEVDAIDVNARRVVFSDGRAVSYDYLIVATGATHAYFGRDAWASVARGLKTVQDAIAIRGRFLHAFEKAEQTTDERRRQALLTFVIVGAGPTGVELAGAMAEIAKNLLPRDFRQIQPQTARVLLLEAGTRVLSAYPEEVSAKALAQLVDLGVEVRLNSLVTEIEPGRLQIGEEAIAAANIVWAAGVAASPLGRGLEAPLDRAGRVRVAPDLSVPGHPEIFVCGDLASLTDAAGKVVPGVAPAAMQMGDYAARRIRTRLNGGRSEPFRYRDKGSLAVIGRGRAVGWRRSVQLSGLPAWLAWLLIHVYFLIGFRNRIVVMLQWAWSYLDFYRGARLITVTDEPSDSTAGPPPHQP